MITFRDFMPKDDEKPIQYNDELVKRVKSSPSMMRESSYYAEFMQEKAQEKAKKEMALKRK